MATLAFSKYSFVILVLVLSWISSQDHLKSEALNLKQKLSGAVVTEMKVNLPANELWDVYRSPDYMKLLASLQPEFFKKVTYVSGNGGIGTIAELTVISGKDTEYWYDNITKIDDKTKTRVQEQIKGRYRDSGFTYFASEYNVIKTGKSSSIIRFSFVFDVKQESQSNVTLVMKTWDPAILVADYVNSKRSKPIVLRKQFSGEILSVLNVNLPTNKLWREYKRLDFGYLLFRLLPDYYLSVIYQGGNGELGTLFNITLKPAFGSIHWVEEYYLYDEAKMTRAIQYVEGRYLISGYTEYKSAFTLIPETKKSTVIRALETYKINPGSLFNASTLRPWWDPAIAISNYTYLKNYQ